MARKSRKSTKIRANQRKRKPVPCVATAIDTWSIRLADLVASVLLFCWRFFKENLYLLEKMEQRYQKIQKMEMMIINSKTRQRLGIRRQIDHLKAGDFQTRWCSPISNLLNSGIKSASWSNSMQRKLNKKKGRMAFPKLVPAVQPPGRPADHREAVYQTPAAKSSKSRISRSPITAEDQNETDYYNS